MINKEVYVLNPNSWHMKLMTWIWGLDHYDFSHMCNYFWLSVFNVVFIIPITVIKVFFIVIIYIYKFVKNITQQYDEWCENKATNYWEKQYEKFDKEVEKGLDSDLIKNLTKTFIGEAGKKDKEFFYKLDYERKDKLDQFKERVWEEYWKDSDKKREVKLSKTIERKQKIAKMAVYAKSILKGLAVIAGLGLLYVLYVTILWFANLDYQAIFSSIGYTLWYAGAILLILSIVAFVILFTYQVVSFLICKFGKYCIPCEMRRNRLVKFFSIIGTVISYPFIKFFNGIVLFVEIVAELKKNHCPAIEWKQDDKS